MPPTQTRPFDGVYKALAKEFRDEEIELGLRSLPPKNRFVHGKIVSLVRTYCAMLRAEEKRPQTVVRFLLGTDGSILSSQTLSVAQGVTSEALPTQEPRTLSDHWRKEETRKSALLQARCAVFVQRIQEESAIRRMTFGAEIRAWECYRKRIDDYSIENRHPQFNDL